jgi:cysteinyl-tRNA synthetase
MNFTLIKFERTSKKLNEFVEMKNYLLIKNNSKESSSDVSILLDELSRSFEMHMGNDLNVKKAFDSILEIISKLYLIKKKGKLSDKDSEILLNKLYKIDNVLKVIFTN